MADYYFIRLGDSGEDATTVALNGEGHVVEPLRRQRLESVAASTSGRRVVVLVPGTEVLATRADIPKASQARLRQLLPYSLEESFATDVESLHFAAGPRTESGALTVSVVARARIDAWLAALAATGIRPHAIYSEADGIPDTPGTLNLLVEGERIYGRRPGAAPFVLEGVGLGDVLGLLATQSGAGPDLDHVLVYLSGEGKERWLAELAEIHSRVASLNVKELGESALARLAATVVFAPGPNLLQGPYATKSDYGALVRPWRLAASVLVAWVAVSLGTQAVEYFTLRRADAALTEQITTICAASFGSSQLSRCSTELRGRLAAAGEQASARGESFLSTLAVIAAAEVADGRIEALSYRNAVMDLQLVVPSVTQLDTFAQGIADSGRFVARIQSTNPNDAGVEGRVQVVEAAQ
jgi:general secretion pathway protein L